MNESEHHLKRGSVVGMLLAVAIASGFVLFDTYPCRHATKNHPEAYFADRVCGASGNYCQLIVGESSKEYADKQTNLFSGGKSLYIASFAVIGLIVGGVTGFMIERRK